jgi:Cu(I)/Ag(I) efflux system protein CusF
MKRWTTWTISAAFALAGSGAGFAATQAHEGHGATHASTAASAYAGVGVVRKVDAAQGRITLQHEPIAALGWPAMTMPFDVKDPKLLAGLAPGDKVRFAFEQQGTRYVITALE